MEKTAQQLHGLVDVNTVIGTPILSQSGAQVIPLTKVTTGYLSGGGEYGDVKALREGGIYPFAGGAGTIVSVKPVGFLVDDGTVRLIRVADDPLDAIIEKAGEIVERLAKAGERS